jgi:hypothetical protein
MIDENIEGIENSEIISQDEARSQEYEHDILQYSVTVLQKP